jgi:MFS family permease
MLFAISFTLFTNSLTISYIYPFAGDMVMKFGMVKEETEEGKYAIWIIMAFFVGRSTTVAKWGKFSDTYGRKTGIMLS